MTTIFNTGADESEANEGRLYDWSCVLQIHTEPIEPIERNGVCGTVGRTSKCNKNNHATSSTAISLLPSASMRTTTHTPTNRKWCTPPRTFYLASFRLFHDRHHCKQPSGISPKNFCAVLYNSRIGCMKGPRPDN